MAERPGSLASRSADSSQKRVTASMASPAYNSQVDEFRKDEYPQLNDVTYLDHAGATLYASSAIKAFSADLCSNLYGNPHSPSPSSQLSTRRIDHVRLRVLQLYQADPQEFDLVFCANATAALKLVADGFSAQPSGFRYEYHADAHTSLVGIRELAAGARCLRTDTEVVRWLESSQDEGKLGLFGWPAQSNLTGRRLPWNWASKLRDSRPKYYSLLDAAAYLTTAPLDFSDAAAAPDFTTLSFYKIFGFPDLGGLIVRRSSVDVLRARKFFGGGTVDSLVSTKTGFVARKNEDPHSWLEDGTCAFHSIVALDSCMDVHQGLYGTPKRVAQHASYLGKLAYDMMSSLRHGNSRKLCVIYGGQDHSSPADQGPIIAFNMQRADGGWIGYSEVEQLASVKNIHLRVGGMCNAGGIELQVGLKPWEIEQNYAAGHKCSDDMDIMNGKPTGAIRVSFGAMSTVDDVLALVRFLEEFYLDKDITRMPGLGTTVSKKTHSVVDAISIYPIKSCGAFKIPPHVPWEVRPHGLAWDREWCLVHLGTGVALSQKAYNSMVMIRPEIDLERGLLRISSPASASRPLEIPLSTPPPSELKSSASRVCGDKITAQIYSAPEIADFFSSAVGVPCTLARFPADATTRNHKPHLSAEKTPLQKREPKILLSNESPILMVNLSSVEALNAEIACSGGKLAKPDVFRANIVLRDAAAEGKAGGSAYKEDSWHHVQIGDEYFELLGPCRRCHMICVDQDTAEKNEEPFVTLSKTRKIDGRVLFGQHAMHLPLESTGGATVPTVKIGDAVTVWSKQNIEYEEEEDQPGASVVVHHCEMHRAGLCEKHSASGNFLEGICPMLPSYIQT